MALSRRAVALDTSGWTWARGRGEHATRSRFSRCPFVVVRAGALTGPSGSDASLAAKQAETASVAKRTLRFHICVAHEIRCQYSK